MPYDTTFNKRYTHQSDQKRGASQGTLVAVLFGLGILFAIGSIVTASIALTTGAPLVFTYLLLTCSMTAFIAATVTLITYAVLT